MAWRTRSSARGTGGIGSLVNPAESNKDWAKLSDRERDRILQSMSEGFPPEYRTVLERYYRRLAEEKTVPTGAAPRRRRRRNRKRTSPDRAVCSRLAYCHQRGRCDLTFSPREKVAGTAG